ncbi:MAG: dTMP kinase [Candidatus Eisenbacteria bacterium]|uniref:Thymidylate kinase n=1 Tax=Eiseniibacteriota bacterium TaxID=2212470 RepID=A0A849SNC1_UNCEI|nr:dTMP kinase [Candidatus Eisenbacteria bacterium]
MPGLFVSFEGGDGSGKSTQIARLAARLQSLGIDPVVTREPGGTAVAEGIRALLLERPERRGGAREPGPTRLAEALLMVAARADLVEKVLRPALESGRVVLCDRYADSTLAYQGGGRGLDAGLLEGWNRAATGGLVPDLTLYFDLDPEVGLARRTGVAGSSNRIDAESLEFHRRVRARYLELAAAEPARWLVLDASAAPDTLEVAVWSAVESRRRGPVRA